MTADGRTPGACSFCPDTLEDPLHALTACTQSQDAATALLTCLHSISPTFTSKDAVNLAINVPSHCELAVVFILCVGLKFIWERRKEGKLATPLEMKGELLARIEVLIQSRFHSEARQAEDAMLYFV